MRQADLASAVGVSPNYVSMLERDLRDPRLGLLRKMAQALGVPLPLIFVLAEDEPFQQRVLSLVTKVLPALDPQDDGASLDVTPS